jgi:hypothetical protein
VVAIIKVIKKDKNRSSVEGEDELRGWVFITSLLKLVIYKENSYVHYIGKTEATFYSQV